LPGFYSWLISFTLDPDTVVAGDGIVDGPEHTEAETRWVAPEKQELHWENWGEQHALYDARSGETHLLAEQTARVLQQLVACPGTAREVMEALCSESGECCDEQSLEHSARLLRQLHNVGLIEKADT
jgi:PqqD family protein of HPr-rel-A system